jgi:hypothetical protein
MELEMKLHAPSALFLENEPWHTLNKRIRGKGDLDWNLWRRKINLPLPGI